MDQIYQFQIDPESNRMAVTIPRSVEHFYSHWEKILTGDGPTLQIAKVILTNEQLVGNVACYHSDDGIDYIGYWLDKEYWGKGIVTQALKLFLNDLRPSRPLYAKVATSNIGSLRVLQKNGFVIERVYTAPADDRCPECEEALLFLPPVHSTSISSSIARLSINNNNFNTIIPPSSTSLLQSHSVYHINTLPPSSTSLISSHSEGEVLSLLMSTQR